MSRPSPTIVKVGGSLYDLPDFAARLSAWLATQTEDVILVPGGGPMVEALRKLDLVHHLGEEVCHWLALRTLTINAHVLAQLLPGATIISDPRQRPTGTIWIMDMYPFSLADEASPDRLPHRWDVTSDSLALRVAIVAEAHRLVLLKSADGEPEAQARDGKDSLACASGSHIVDCYFHEVLRKAPPELLVHIVNLRTWDPERQPSPLPSNRTRP